MGNSHSNKNGHNGDMEIAETGDAAERHDGDQGRSQELTHKIGKQQSDAFEGAELLERFRGEHEKDLHSRNQPYHGRT